MADGIQAGTGPVSPALAGWSAKRRLGAYTGTPLPSELTLGSLSPTVWLLGGGARGAVTCLHRVACAAAPPRARHAVTWRKRQRDREQQQMACLTPLPGEGRKRQRASGKGPPPTKNLHQSVCCGWSRTTWDSVAENNSDI